MPRKLTALFMLAAILATGMAQGGIVYTCRITGHQSSTCCCKPAQAEARDSGSGESCCKGKTPQKTPVVERDSNCGCCSVSMTAQSDSAASAVPDATGLNRLPIQNAFLHFAALLSVFDFGRTTVSSSPPFLGQQGSSPPLFLIHRQIRR